MIGWFVVFPGKFSLFVVLHGIHRSYVVVVVLLRCQSGSYKISSRSGSPYHFLLFLLSPLLRLLICSSG